MYSDLSSRCWKHGYGIILASPTNFPPLPNIMLSQYKFEIGQTCVGSLRAPWGLALLALCLLLPNPTICDEVWANPTSGPLSSDFFPPKEILPVSGSTLSRMPGVKMTPRWSVFGTPISPWSVRVNHSAYSEWLSLLPQDKSAILSGGVRIPCNPVCPHPPRYLVTFLELKPDSAPFCEQGGCGLTERGCSESIGAWPPFSLTGGWSSRANEGSRKQPSPNPVFTTVFLLLVYLCLLTCLPCAKISHCIPDPPPKSNENPNKVSVVQLFITLKIILSTNRSDKTRTTLPRNRKYWSIFLSLSKQDKWQKLKIRREPLWQKRNTLLSAFLRNHKSLAIPSKHRTMVLLRRNGPTRSQRKPKVYIKRNTHTPQGTTLSEAPNNAIAKQTHPHPTPHNNTRPKVAIGGVPRQAKRRKLNTIISVSSIKGLHNYGNTCYFNSAAQILRVLNSKGSGNRSLETFISKLKHPSSIPNTFELCTVLNCNPYVRDDAGVVLERIINLSNDLVNKTRWTIHHENNCDFTSMMDVRPRGNTLSSIWNNHTSDLKVGHLKPADYLILRLEAKHTFTINPVCINNLIYDTIGIIHHTGLRKAGHFYTEIRTARGWLNINDTGVTDSPNPSLTHTAYVLVLAKQGTVSQSLPKRVVSNTVVTPNILSTNYSHANHNSPSSKFNKFSKTGTLKGLKNHRNKCGNINMILQATNSINLGRCKHDLVNSILTQMNTNNNCYYKHARCLNFYSIESMLLANFNCKKSVQFLKSDDVPCNKPVVIQLASNTAKIPKTYILMGVGKDNSYYCRTNFNRASGWCFQNLTVKRYNMNEAAVLPNTDFKIFIKQDNKHFWNPKPYTLIRKKFKKPKSKGKFRISVTPIPSTPWLKGYYCKTTKEYKMAAVLQLLGSIKTPCPPGNSTIGLIHRFQNHEGPYTLRNAIRLCKSLNVQDNTGISDILYRCLTSNKFSHLKEFLTLKWDTVTVNAALNCIIKTTHSEISITTDQLKALLQNKTPTSCPNFITISCTSPTPDSFTLPDHNDIAHHYTKAVQICKSGTTWTAERDGYSFQGFQVHEQSFSSSAKVIIYTCVDKMHHPVKKLTCVNCNPQKDTIMFITNHKMCTNRLAAILRKFKLPNLAQRVMNEGQGTFSVNTSLLDVTPDTTQILDKIRHVVDIYRVILPPRLKPYRHPSLPSRKETLINHIKDSADALELSILESTQFDLENKSNHQLQNILSVLSEQHIPSNPPTDSKHITIRSININNLGAGGEKLNDVLVDTPSIVCIQEVKTNKIPHYPQYSCLTHNKSNRGTAILIHDSMKSSCKRLLHPSEESSAIKLTIKGKSIKIFNCYLPVAKRGNVDLHQSSLDKLSAHIKGNMPVIITGDMNGWIKTHNSHKTEWKNNKPPIIQGRQLEQFASKHSLEILNKEPKENTRIDSRGNQSTLDYFLYKNLQLGPQLISASIDKTDHRAITTTIINTKKPHTRRKPSKLQRPVHKLHEDNELRHNYREALEKERVEWTTKHSDPDKANTALKSIILKCSDDTVGKEYISPARNKIWWDSEYAEQKKLLKKEELARKDALGNWKSPEDKEVYLNRQKILAKLRKNKKHRKWTSELREINRHFRARSKKWRNKMKTLFKNTNNKISSINGKTSDKDIAREFAKHYETLGKLIVIPTPNSPPVFSQVVSSITQDEVEAAMSRLINDKAAPDEVRNEMIKYGKEVMVEYLTHLFQLCWHQHKTPRDWRKGLITSLYKKGPKDNPSNYRPITLLPVIGKIYATILNIRLSNHLEQNNLLDTTQNGFRMVEQRNCEDHVFSLSELCRFSKAHKRPLHIGFIDFKSAFDAVPRNALMYQLTQLGIEKNLYDAISGLYQHTEAQALANGVKSDTFEIERGVAQGCPLSPTLFAVYINSLLIKIKNSGLGTDIDGFKLGALAYADDIVLLADSPDDLQKLTNICQQWCTDWGMNASASVQLSPSPPRIKLI